MTATRKAGMALGAMALGLGLLGTVYAQTRSGTQDPAYSSSVQVKDRDREERGERHEEQGEAGRLAALAKIDASQASAAAVAQVPGTVLAVALENENGNVVYSVEIKTTSNEMKTVKVDAGTGKVLHVAAAGQDDEEEEEEG
ncbi:MAG TPA: PepSY domain-containing protein [Methylomirabilota bacterium]|nr:PepSY domain-containing protein [Methylomirabilota bacterium]